MTIEDMLSEHAVLKEKIEDLDSKKKEAQKELDTINEGIVSRFESEGIMSSKTGKGSFIMSTRNRYSIRSEVKQEVLEAFKQHFPDLVTNAIHHRTLDSFMKEAEEAGQVLPQEIQQGIKCWAQKIISWKRG